MVSTDLQEVADEIRRERLVLEPLPELMFLLLWVLEANDGNLHQNSLIVFGHLNLQCEETAEATTYRPRSVPAQVHRPFPPQFSTLCRHKADEAEDLSSALQTGSTNMSDTKKTVSQYVGTCPELETIEKYCETLIPLEEMQDVKEHIDCCQVCWMTVQAWAGQYSKKTLHLVR